MADAKSIIEEISDIEKNAHDRHIKRTINTLKSIKSDLNKNEKGFIYEIIQNANDFPNNLDKVNLTFQLSDKWLLIYHNGREFSENNIKAICDINKSDEEKKTNNQTIGYKGIGFKSVFKFSEEVFINSGPFSIKFSKIITGEDLPWQITPIWVDQEEFSNLFNNNEFKDFNSSKVSIALSLLKNNEIENSKIEKNLNEVFESEISFLFVPKISTLNLINPSGETNTLKKENNNTELTIYKNEEENSKFITFEKEFQLNDILSDEEFKELQKELDNDEVPEKWKGIRSIKIQFLKNKDHNKVYDNDIFCYLPTKENYSFPFLVNSDFIPDYARTHLLEENLLNKIIFKEIAKSHIDWLKNLLENEDWDNFFELLIEKQDHQESKILYTEFISEYENCLKNKAFIFDINNNFQLLNNLVYDETSIFNTKLFKEHQEKITQPYWLNNKEIISYSLRDIKDKFIEKNYLLKITKFEKTDLESLLNTDEIKQILLNHKDLSINTIKEFYEWENTKSEEVLNYLKNIELIPSHSDENTFYSPNEITIGIKEEYKSLLDELNIYKIPSSSLESELVKLFNFSEIKETLEIKTFSTESIMESTFIQNMNIDKLMINDNDDLNIKSQKIDSCKLLWKFIIECYLDQDFDKDKINSTFKCIPIVNIFDDTILLENSKIQKKDNNDFQFSIKNFMPKSENIFNINEYKFGNNRDEIIKIFKKIKPSIEKDSKDIFNEIRETINTLNFESIINNLIPEDIFKIADEFFEFYKNNKFERFPDQLPVKTIHGIEPSKDVYFLNKQTPIEYTGLRAENIFKINPKTPFLSHQYYKDKSSEDKKLMTEFFKELGVSYGFKKHTYYNDEIIIIKNYFSESTIRINSNFSFTNGYNFHIKNSICIVFKNLETIFSKTESANIFLQELGENPKKLIGDYEYIAHNRGFTNSTRKRTNINIQFIKNHESIPVNGCLYKPSSILRLEYKNYNLENALFYDFRNPYKQNELEKHLRFRSLSPIEICDCISYYNNGTSNLNDYIKFVNDELLYLTSSEEKINIFRDNLKLKSYGGNLILVKDQFFIDKSLVEKNILNSYKKDNRFLNVEGFENAIIDKLIEALGLKAINIDNLFIIESEQEIINEDLKENIKNALLENVETNETIEELFEKYTIIKQPDLTISFDNYNEYIEAIPFYIDNGNNKIYFQNNLDLLNAINEVLENSITPLIISRINKQFASQSENENSSENDAEDNNEDVNLEVIYSDEEITYLESIITGEIDFNKSDQFSINKNALFRAILYLKEIGYTINDELAGNFDGENEKKFRDGNGNIHSFIIRSAVKGVLFLDPSSWEKLPNLKTFLLIYLGQKSFIRIDNKEDLINKFPELNKFGLVRASPLESSQEIKVKDFDDLLFEREDEDDFNDLKYEKYHLLFLVKKNQRTQDLMNLVDVFTDLGGDNDSE